MLSKKIRLDRKDFRGVFSIGKKISAAYTTLIFIKVPSGQSKFSVTAPVSIFKKAHLRNKARRRAYSALLPTYKIFSSGLHAVFILRKEFLTLPLEVLREDMGIALRKAVVDRR